MIRRHMLSSEDSERIAKELELGSSAQPDKTDAEKPESAFAPEPEKDSVTASGETFISEDAPKTEQIPESGFSGSEIRVVSDETDEIPREDLSVPDGSGSAEETVTAEADPKPKTTLLKLLKKKRKTNT